MNKDLLLLHKWCTYNRMQVNVDQTKHNLISSIK